MLTKAVGKGTKQKAKKEGSDWADFHSLEHKRLGKDFCPQYDWRVQSMGRKMALKYFAQVIRHSLALCMNLAGQVCHNDPFWGQTTFPLLYLLITFAVNHPIPYCNNICFSLTQWCPGDCFHQLGQLCTSLSNSVFSNCLLGA